jgi:hypothetical protein
MLQSCFKEYKYWNLRGMCERLQQPAAFVKGVLQEVAEYQTTGPYHGELCLHEDFKGGWVYVAALTSGALSSTGYWCLKPSLQKTTTSLQDDSSPAPLELAPDDVKPTPEQLADLARRQRERELDQAQLGGEASDEDDGDDDDDDEEMEEVEV